MAGAVNLDGDELVDGGVVLTESGAAAAVDFFEDFVGGEVLGVDVAEGVLGLFRGESGDTDLDDFVLDAEEAVVEPHAVDGFVTESVLDVGARAEALLDFADEGGELGGVFAGEDVGVGVDAEFDGVAGRGGFAFGGARAGGMLRVGDGGGELGWCGHE